MILKNLRPALLDFLAWLSDWCPPPLQIWPPLGQPTDLHGLAEQPEDAGLRELKALVDFGCDLDARDQAGFTPLHVALDRRNLLCAE